MYRLLFSLLLLPQACQSRPVEPQVAPKEEAHAVAQEAAEPQRKHAKAIYTPADSAEVVSLLADTAMNGTLDLARHFIGRPYVAHTLEVADPECLVVNLRQLDCTTLVETVAALQMTRSQGGKSFDDFCCNLERIRYFGGRCDGYLSRLHYFSFWMHDNIDKGIVEEVSLPQALTRPLNVKLNYMSRNWQKYKMLEAHPQWADSIAVLEEEYSKADGRYLPEASVGLPKIRLGAIKDGDIIAIVTTKNGLDYSHLGFASWGKDGLLHLLNASSVHHKVVDEPMTLRQYLARHPSSTGIRVLRLR